MIMQRESSIRVVLAGPESSGKSSLVSHLAARFRVPFALEYARFYLEKHGPAYDLPLLLNLSRSHRAYQRRRVPIASPVGLFDTDLINYKIWCEVVYGVCPPEILKPLEKESNHVYLLCAPDLRWESDPLRESEHERPLLFERHRLEIERRQRPYFVIEGQGPARIACAEAAYRKLTGAC